jgi:adenosylcobinamide kinase / adenosylcobinamide-phosphate guanylyltransferase
MWTEKAANLVLVLGGARSGKSRYAEGLIMRCPRPWYYLATAKPGDAEMAERIARHRARRGEAWQTIEAPDDITGALRQAAGAVLVDCLTLWLSNRMLAGADMTAEFERLEAVLACCTGMVVLVSNEVGSGVVPDNALGRRFRDLQGELNQRVAELANRVVLVVAGVPLTVKDTVQQAVRETP